MVEEMFATEPGFLSSLISGELLNGGNGGKGGIGQAGEPGEPGWDGT